MIIAVSKVEEHLALGGLTFEGETVFTKSQVAELLEVDDHTVERYLASNGEELKQNGYRLLKGKGLKDFKKLHVSDIHVGDKAPSARVRQEAAYSHGKVLTKAIPLADSESLPVTVIRSPVESISTMAMTVRLWQGKLLEVE